MPIAQLSWQIKENIGCCFFMLLFFLFSCGPWRLDLHVALLLALSWKRVLPGQVQWRIDNLMDFQRCIRLFRAPQAPRKSFGEMHQTSELPCYLLSHSQLPYCPAAARFASVPTHVCMSH